MKTIYVLQSLGLPNKFYTGIATDIQSRLKAHNAGRVPYSSKFRPWKLDVTVGFEDEEKARAFEKYLKSGSGREFARRHF